MESIRSLVKQGRGALTVTLPSKWLKENNLKGGDKLFFSEKENKLVIEAEKRKSARETTVDIRECEWSLSWHKVIASYIAGYDEITILFDDQKIVNEIAGTLVGMVITQQRKQSCVIKDIVQVPEKNMDEVFRRVTHLLKQQCSEVSDYYNNNAEYDSIKSIERIINQQTWYCLRYLNKYYESDKEKTHRYFSMCLLIEHGSDQLLRIAKYKHNASDAEKRFLKELRNILDIYFETLFKEKKGIEELYKRLRSLRELLKRKSFVEGIMMETAENLYNFMGYLMRK